MIAGIEGIHSWRPPGELEPVLSLGLIRDLETNIEVWPRYRIREINGLSSLADPQDNRENAVGRLGEIARLSKRRGKTVVYTGRIEARGARELREAETDLRAAFAVLDTEGRMIAAWHPANTEFADLEPRFFDARPLACEIVDVQDGQQFFRPFVVSMRMSDPRYFDDSTEISETLTVTSTNTSYEIEDS